MTNPRSSRRWKRIMQIGGAAVIATTFGVGAATPAPASSPRACSSSRPACGGPYRPSLRLYWTRHKENSTVDGRYWLPLSKVRVSFVEKLGEGSRSRPPAVTGVWVRTDVRGRFRVVVSKVGICGFGATVHAKSAVLSAPPVASRSVCMESPHPVLPIEHFRVAIGTNLGAVYVRKDAHRRYSEALGHEGSWVTRALSRRRAIEIARQQAGAGAGASVTTAHGSVPVGLAGVWTSAWQVWVGGVKVPGYGAGHMVVLIVRASQRGFLAKKGTVLGWWYAP